MPHRDACDERVAINRDCSRDKCRNASAANKRTLLWVLQSGPETGCHRVSGDKRGVGTLAGAKRSHCARPSSIGPTRAQPTYIAVRRSSVADCYDLAWEQRAATRWGDLKKRKFLYAKGVALREGSRENSDYIAR
jgi:hypothetical protein